MSIQCAILEQCKFGTIQTDIRAVLLESAINLQVFETWGWSCIYDMDNAPALFVLSASLREWCLWFCVTNTKLAAKSTPVATPIAAHPHDVECMFCLHVVLQLSQLSFVMLLLADVPPTAAIRSIQLPP